MGRRPKSDLSRLAVTAQQQLKRAELLGKSLDVRLQQKRTAHAAWTPDEDFRRDMEMVTRAVKDCGNALQRALEGNEKHLGGLSPEQLEAQFQAELVRAAQTMPDEMWNKMVEARRKAKS